MKKAHFATGFAALAAGFAAATALFSEPAEPQDYYGRIAQRVTAMLPRYHVLQRPVDDEISRRAWTNLVTYYDFDHSVFLQSDLDRLAAHELTIDDELKEGDVGFGYEIYSLYCERLRERVDFATNLLAAATWDFTKDESYRVKRKDAPWPATREEAEEHWRRRIKNEVLVQTLARELDAEEKAEREARKAAKKAAGTAADSDGVAAASGDDGDDDDEDEEEDSGASAAPDPADAVDRGIADEADGEYDDKSLTPEQNLIKKYRQYYIALTEPDEEDVLQHYLSALCRAYDPHTDYLSPMTKEDFDMDMNLTLCGVGAVLSMDDGALKIAEVMPGGPMDLDGRIKEGDKIVGVKQADGEMEDIMWRPMKKTIHKIRGKKGTRVTLEIVPRSDPTGATRKLVELVRDEIKLEEQAATGHVERVSVDGFDAKLGYVYLPGFYGTMDKNPGDEGFLSCAADVAAYIAEFNAQDVGGLVLDLRGDGGGSLKEAVVLSSLFVSSGPVVQIRDVMRTVPLPIPRGNPVAFRKPLVVLVDRASASASEIVAGHLRDVGRAVVLGDARTHGKGTVQTVMKLGPDKYGSMKITTARFYRVNGRSTQVEGVESDVHLPSFLDSLDIGEDKLPNALPFTRIRPADYRRSWNMDTYAPRLAALSKARTDADPAFVRHVANVAASKAVYDREEVPLEREARKRMMKADRKITDAEADDEADKKNTRKGRRGRRRDKATDLVLDEAYRILADLVRLNGGEELTPAAVDWYNSLLGF